MCDIESILLNYYVTTIYVHEIALHVNHNVDDFRPPFTERIIREPSLKAHVLVPGYQLSSISDCVSASQALLETFLTYSIPELLCVPVFTFVRTVYACLMLIKISVTASVPDGELGKLINNDELQTEEYINRTRVHMGKAAQDDRSRPARKFTMILLRLQTWYLKRIAELVPLKPQSSETVMENNESPRTNTTAEAVPRTADPHQESSAHLQRLSNANLASETTGDQDKLRQPQMQPQQQLTCYPEQQQIQQPMNSNYYANPVDSGWPSRESVGLGAEGTAGFVGFPVAQLVPLDNSLTDDSFWEMMHPQGNIGDGTWQGDPGAPWSGYSL